MIPVEHYTLFYFLGLSLWTCILCMQLGKYSSLNHIPNEVLFFFTGTLLCYTVLFIGLRDPLASSLYLGDTSAYTNYFETINQRSLQDEKEWGFYYLMKLFQPFGVRVFYLACAFLYVVLPYITFRKFFGRYSLFVLVFLISTMSFWGFGINGLRNGLASSIFVFALSFYPRKILMYLLMWVSTFFHQSMYLPLLCFVIAHVFRNTKYLVALWFGAIFISFILGEKINDGVQSIFGLFGFEGDRADNLFIDVKELRVFKTGFRWDFILYSAVAVYAGYFYMYKKKFQDHLYQLLYRTYILANIIWIIMIYAPFTNRTAYLSWFLMPLLLMYPILKYNSIFVNKSKAIIAMIISSLFFTIIMQFK